MKRGLSRGRGFSNEGRGGGGSAHFSTTNSGRYFNVNAQYRQLLPDSDKKKIHLDTVHNIDKINHIDTSDMSTPSSTSATNPTTSHTQVRSISASSNNHLLHSNSNKITSTKYSNITMDMWNYYSENAQSHICFSKKVELKEALYHMFKDVFPNLGVYIVGSSANGFGTNQSDVDVCLMITDCEINQKTEAVHLLRLIARAMRKASFIANLQVISAKVPIIKFHDCHNNLDCDINLNNKIGIRNTHLLKSYSDQDWRVKPFVINIKNWAKFHNINDASQQTISSYSLVLMAIFYMQAVCQPPILPVLQDLYPEKFDTNIEVDELRLNEQLPTFTSQNIQTLGELFYGFLDYYSKLSFQLNVISVRKGKLLPKSAFPYDEIENTRTSQWKYILIEEPFDLSNTARSVYDETVFGKILNVFFRSKKRLEETQRLQSLFEVKYYDDERFSYNNIR